MKTTNLVGRTGALALALACLLTIPTAPAGASSTFCPDCSQLSASITFDFVEDDFTLTIDAFPNFDYSGADSVELLIEEGTTEEWITVDFVLSDIDSGVTEIGALPTSITGSGTEAYLRIYDSTSTDETYVAVTIQ